MANHKSLPRSRSLTTADKDLWTDNRCHVLTWDVLDSILIRKNKVARDELIQEWRDCWMKFGKMLPQGLILPFGGASFYDHLYPNLVWYAALLENGNYYVSLEKVQRWKRERNQQAVKEGTLCTTTSIKKYKWYVQERNKLIVTCLTLPRVLIQVILTCL
jgi:hypothetical protein